MTLFDAVFSHAIKLETSDLFKILVIGWRIVDGAEVVVGRGWSKTLIGFPPARSLAHATRRTAMS